jgi:hypothetical protein
VIVAPDDGVEADPSKTQSRLLPVFVTRQVLLPEGPETVKRATGAKGTVVVVVLGVVVVVVELVVVLVVVVVGVVVDVVVVDVVDVIVVVVAVDVVVELCVRWRTKSTCVSPDTVIVRVAV